MHDSEVTVLSGDIIPHNTMQVYHACYALYWDESTARAGPIKVGRAYRSQGRKPLTIMLPLPSFSGRPTAQPFPGCSSHSEFFPLLRKSTHLRRVMCQVQSQDCRPRVSALLVVTVPSPSLKEPTRPRLFVALRTEPSSTLRFKELLSTTKTVYKMVFIRSSKIF